MDTAKQLIILGCGGHARSVADVALSTGTADLIFLDPNMEDKKTLFGFPIQKEIIEIPSGNWQFFVALGDNLKRFHEIKRIGEHSWSLAKVISLTATVGIDSLIAEGCFIGHHAHVGPMVTLGLGGIINTAAVVEHDSCIGAYTHISVNTTLAGYVSIGDRCFIGAGATIVDGIKICADVIVGAGAVVTKDIESPGTYVGVPARRIK